MKGRVLVRQSRYARLLPMAALSGLLVVLPSCASKGGQEQGTPTPAEAPKPAPKPTASAQPKAPAQPVQPAPAPATPAPPPGIDTAAVVAQFCSRITSGIKIAIRRDSTPPDPVAVTKKVADGIPEATAAVALAKGTTCR